MLMQENGLGTSRARDVDAFGLDEFGQPTGLNPLWGAVAGTGLGTIGAIAVRQFTSYGKHSELIGFGLGALASGVMIFFKGTRAAGWTGLAAAFLNNGLRQLEGMLMAAPAAAAGTGMGDVTVEPITALRGAGQFGVVEMEQETALTGPTADREGMPQLVGAGIANASQHVQLLGGPGLAQFAGHWGATVMPG